MDIYLHNTLTGKKELFVPLVPKKITMYNCGPTVYNYAHIGNLRSYIFADTIRRMFEYNGYIVEQVVNITDIGHLSGDADDGDDKMTKALRREDKPLTLEAMREVADFYFDKFRSDLEALNIELPEKFPFASDHIEEDIALVELLRERGFTYTISDGVYFDTSKFPEYGVLGGINKLITEENNEDNEDSEDSESHSRIGLNSEKKNSRDFALWKFSTNSTNSSESLGYDSLFGRGFPGWHIECSAMSVKYLGAEFDIHTGGIDHIPVHHNNEIAQSVCAGYPFARVWMHNAFLNIKSNAGEDLKMAKSGDNFITLQSLCDRGISPIAYRYFLLTARYSSAVDFSWEALEAAQTALTRLKTIVQNLPEDVLIPITESSPITETYTRLFTEYINDDLNTPKAMALLWDILKIEDGSLDPSRKRLLASIFDPVLGLELFKKKNILKIPQYIKEIIIKRNIARNEKNWKLSDELRDKIEEAEFIIKDTETGTEVEEKSRNNTF